MDSDTNNGKIEFESVSLSQFYGNEKKTLHPTGIILLTTKQSKMVGNLMQKIKLKDKDHYNIFLERMQDLENLAESIAKFPSLLERHELTGGLRTPQSLIDSLISSTNEGDQTLQLPSKATLGKGFLVAKIHTFSGLSKLAKRTGEPESVVEDFKRETITMMFSLLAEDIYLNLIKDKTIDMEFRRQMAISVLLLWEHRSDQTIADVAPVLQAVWEARRKLAPAFGTMKGMSELLLISIQMDSQWAKFIKDRLSEPDVSQAMEEFLFGLSYEQINKLQSILNEKGISAIGRDDVSKFLGQPVKADAGLDYRDFYSMYTIRRDNARTRQRMNLAGPHYTLEDHFIRFIMELNKEKQIHDTFANK